MMKLKLLLTILLIFLMSCKTIEPVEIVLPDPVDNPEIIKVVDLQTAGEQIIILTIQELKWRLVYLDIEWVLGYISDEERNERRDFLLSKIDKLTEKE